MERRRLLRLAGTAIATGTAGITGCLGDGSGENDTDNQTDQGTDANETADEGPQDYVEVTAGPEGRWAFEPEEVEVTVGGTVEWYFASGGHNATSDPDAHYKCENPEGAEPFRSYEGDSHLSVNSVDSTFSHTFETAGEYTYVCVPHATRMVGKITVVDE
ncbi:plastocyanin/azurin family copper-binding protein [Haladaptatus sp. F3-133]|jgi:plastocyanin|uniref:Plastocyanin/azurin family copper-binding protein n=1 Tax=Halorutilus salinus TaxID=2487751 RepID=A0A9Q4C562_9EURY|nr:plastocyanin/azurin family copper-binding protein [Halorutilus salinus]MCX2819463.1 plastocyanin/azurin family copper-binding protein [Halorutilus salinus]